MKKYTSFVYLLCSLSTLSGCDLLSRFDPPLVTIVNNSNRHLIFDISENYPDTLLSYAQEIYYLRPYEKVDVEYYIRRKKLFKKIDFLQIMIYSKEYLSLPVDTLRKYNNKYIIKRYQLSKHDLDSMNWTVAYP